MYLHRGTTRCKESEIVQSHHSDLFFSYCFGDDVECQEVHGARSVSLDDIYDVSLCRHPLDQSLSTEITDGEA